MNHLLRASDVLFPDMWVAPAAGAAGGMWVPSHWVRNTFVIDDATAARVLTILRVRGAALRACVCVQCHTCMSS